MDIQRADLCFALYRCLVPGPVEKINPPIPASSYKDRHLLAALSVRSGLDLFMQAVKIPKGSEVMVSAITHPEMISILRHHGLKPIPIDIDPSTLAPRLKSIIHAVGPHTKALMVAHLFGAHFSLGDIVTFCRREDLYLIEDCAQAYDSQYYGHPGADISLFSFGPLKTVSALGGALLWVRDSRIFSKMGRLHGKYPVQSNSDYAKRIVKYGCLDLLSSSRILYGIVCRLLGVTGRSVEEVLRSWISSFPGGFEPKKLRKRPSDPLLNLLARRLRRQNLKWLQERIAVGRWVSRELSSIGRPGEGATKETYWIFPVLVKNRDALISALRMSGFQAIKGLSNLCVLEAPPGRPELYPVQAKQILSGSILLPVYPDLTVKERKRLVQTVLEKTEEG